MSGDVLNAGQDSQAILIDRFPHVVDVIPKDIQNDIIILDKCGFYKDAVNLIMPYLEKEGYFKWLNAQTAQKK